MTSVKLTFFYQAAFSKLNLQQTQPFRHLCQSKMFLLKQLKQLLYLSKKNSNYMSLLHFQYLCVCFPVKLHQPTLYDKCFYQSFIFDIKTNVNLSNHLSLYPKIQKMILIIYHNGVVIHSVRQKQSGQRGVKNGFYEICTEHLNLST